MVDAMIRLFEDTANSFDNNGIGYLSDATVCQVTEERNGVFELKMKYPIKGIRYSEIKMRRIIVAKPNPYSNPQPFRIYSISKPISGIVTINAEHISYDMSGFPVTPFEATSVSTALSGLKDHSAVSCPFDFWTDKSGDGNFKINTPVNVRNCLGGMEGSILDVFGTGEYEFDRYDVKLYLHRGLDRGVTLRYGKNITDLKQEENNANVYTGVYPYWYSEEDGLVTSNPQIINGPGTYNYQKIYILDLSYDWIEKPTPDDLKEAAEKYIETNDIGIPKVSLDVSFVHLADSDEYSEFRDLETVHLCDTVTVIFDELGVNASSKCIKTVYDCLTDKYDSISLGDSKTNLADTIAGNQTSLDDKLNNQKSFLEKAIGSATAMITGNLGGYVVLHSTTGSRKPDEILIMDTEDIQTAQNVWRWNASGLGYSSTGYNGPYETAITADGKIVADFITTGTMTANRINGGTLVMGGENNINGTILMQSDDPDRYGTWKENGITLRRGNFNISGLFLDGTNLTDIYTRYSGVRWEVFKGGLDDEVVFRQGLLGSSWSNVSYALAVGRNLKALGLGRISETGGFSGSFFINYGGNPSGYTERIIIAGSTRCNNYFYIGDGNLHLWHSNYDGKDSLSVAGGLYVEGSIGCSGSKNRVVETEHYGHRMMNSMESPEPRFFDFGSCVVGYNGTISCEMDPIFMETIEDGVSYQVFLTRTNEPSTINKEPWVEKHRDHFIIHGEPGSKYDVMISAIQKGYSGVRLKEANIPIFAQNEIINEEEM